MLFCLYKLFQVTRGGGALTLASQWKSQFDDSEETTDNEWKQEPQVCILIFKKKRQSTMSSNRLLKNLKTLHKVGLMH